MLCTSVVCIRKGGVIRKELGGGREYKRWSGSDTVPSMEKSGGSEKAGPNRTDEVGRRVWVEVGLRSLGVLCLASVLWRNPRFDRYIS